MESKIMISIDYASRQPQVRILYKDSDDPRDTLVSMFIGQSMPGVSDGYCRIERYAGQEGDARIIVITPIHPTEMINHIPAIAKYAHENAASDTSEIPQRYRKILEQEYNRLSEAAPGKIAEPAKTPQQPSLLPVFEQICRPLMPESSSKSE